MSDEEERQISNKDNNQKARKTSGFQNTREFTRRLANSMTAANEEDVKKAKTTIDELPSALLILWSGRVRRFYNFTSLPIVYFSLLLVALLCGTSISGLYYFYSPDVLHCMNGSITIGGSSNVNPLLKRLAQSYESQCSGAKITIDGGHNNGITLVDTNKNIAIGSSDSNIYGTATHSNLVDHQVVIVVLALVISGIPNATNISSATLNDIYNGNIVKWREAHIDDRDNHRITIVNHHTYSDIQSTFDKFVLGGPETLTGPTNLMSDDSNILAHTLQNYPGAIGYLPLYYANTYNLHIVTIDNLGPTIELVKNGSYKLWNIEHLYTRGRATGLSESFINYIQTFEARSIAEQNGFLSVSDVGNLLTSHE